MTAQTASPTANTTGPKVWSQSVARGFFLITHNGLALLGMLLAVALLTLGLKSDWRNNAEQQLLGWLQNRQANAQEDSADITLPADLSAAERVSAVLPSELPAEQAKIALWLSRKYRVAPEPLGALVAEAFDIGTQAKLDSTLLLAVMAIESRFNPFAQSAVGAQGLMQVMTRVHTEKYNDFGGRLAAFDPVANLRVGAQVLHEYVRRTGSIEGGLRLYVGAVTSDGSNYINKVMAEYNRLQRVMLGAKARSASAAPFTVTPPINTVASKIKVQVSEVAEANITDAQQVKPAS